jgi:hypothetical protein
MHQLEINVLQIFDSGIFSYFMLLFILGRDIFVLDSFFLLMHYMLLPSVRHMQ